MLNTVLAVVALQPGDRIKPEKPAEKASAAEEGAGGEAEGQDGEAEVKAEDEDEEEEVPYLEEIGWREVLGFVVMYVRNLYSHVE